MPLLLTSPKHSFVNLNGLLSDVILPAYNGIDIAFQFMFSVDNMITLDTPVKVGVANTSGAIIEANFDATNICAWGRFEGISFLTDFPITVATFALKGVYQSPAELLTAIRNTYNVDANGQTFLQCCSLNDLPDITFVYNSKSATVKWYKALQQVTIIAPAPVALGQCFKYVVSVAESSVLSNTFQLVSDSKFLTKVIYSNNEDAYGFSYPSGLVFNKLYLPILVKKPKYPETRKVYIKSSKQYKVQSASIEKEWECKTEHLPDEIHEKIAVMLSHDNVHFTNSKIDSDVFKKDDYTIDWPDDDVSESAIASFKINTPFEGRNSNCDKRRICLPALHPAECVPVVLDTAFILPAGMINHPYRAAEQIISGSLPYVLAIITRPSWMNISIQDGFVIYEGVPMLAGENIPVRITVTNCNDAVAPYAGSFNVTSGTVVEFAGTIFVSGDASTDTERATITGVAGSTVTITLTNYTNTNNGGTGNINSVLEVQGQPAYEGDIWNIVLDANGIGYLDAAIRGDASNSGTVIRGIFTITAATDGTIISNSTTGTIGGSNTYQISKIF